MKKQQPKASPRTEARRKWRFFTLKGGEEIRFTDEEMATLHLRRLKEIRKYLEKTSVGTQLMTVTTGRRLRGTDEITAALKDPRTLAKALRKFRQLERERIGAQRFKTFPPVAPSRTCDGHHPFLHLPFSILSA
jgi:hypothetical protein